MNLKMHADLCTQMHELCVAKNKRYGDSFSKTVQHYGLISALTRMSDKWNRIETLILGRADESTDESLVDSLTDLANYCIMTVCEIQDSELKAKTSETTSQSRKSMDELYTNYTHNSSDAVFKAFLGGVTNDA